MPCSGETIELTHRDVVVAFEFAALDYTDTKRNRYRSKLEDFDEDWVNLGSRRRATYTNLEPARYTFRVRASNNDGVWNETGLAVNLTKKSAPWQTVSA